MPDAKRYVGIDPSALKAGDEAKIVESYKSGLEVIYDGQVHEVIGEVIAFAVRKDGEPGVVRALTKNRDYCSVRAYIVPPQLPQVAGTIIKFYDTNHLQNRVAVRALDGEWYSTDTPGRSGEPLGPIAPVEWTVLFDPQKDR